MRSTLLNQLRRNWFKLFFLGLLVYIFFKKDLSFQINMHAPDPIEEQAPALSPGATERLTDNANPGVQTSTFDRFQLPGFRDQPQSRLATALRAVSDEDRMAYLRRFARVAISERKKYGIPSSLILANALLQSTAGRSEIAEAANNHFGLTASSGWSGLEFRHQGTAYRMYENAWSSFRDHSEYLAGLELGELRRPDATNYQDWIALLTDIGYAENTAWKDLMLEIIQTYQLYELDTK